MKSQPSHRRKKLLYIITQGAWGGAQTYVFDLATNLTEQYDVTVAIGEPTGKNDLTERLTIWNNASVHPLAIIQLRHLVRPIQPIHDVFSIFELRSLYKKLQPDIVHLNSSKASIVGSLAATSLSNPPTIIYTAHGWVFNEPIHRLKQLGYTLFEKITARMKDHTIVLSEEEYATAAKMLRMPKEKLSLIPLGYTPPQEQLTRQEARQKILSLFPYLSGKPTWIGCVANLYHTKGADLLIEALQKHVRSFPTAQCLIIGDGPERAILQERIKRHQLESHVFLLGRIEKSARYLPAFDFLVIPSRKEGVPYVLLEAIAAEVPVIANRVGGIPSLLSDMHTGLLSDPNDTISLEKKILFALNHEAQMKQMADTAKKEVRLSSQETMIQTVDTLYKKIA